MNWGKLTLGRATRVALALAAYSLVTLTVSCARSVSSLSDATWHRLSTSHFVVLTADDVDIARGFVEDLERFRTVMLQHTSFHEPDTMPRLRILLARNEAEFHAFGGDSGELFGRGTAGFFIPTLRGNMAILVLRPTVRMKGTGTNLRTASYSRQDEAVRATLFHEYVHFVEAVGGSATPSWYKEGFAEYMSTVEFRDDGSYTTGRPPKRPGRKHRWASWERLMTAPSISHMKADAYDTYAQAWAAVHYFLSEPSRTGQLNRYLELIGSGASHAKAVQGAMGMGTAELGRALSNYAMSAQFDYVGYPAPRQRVRPPHVQKLSVASARTQMAGMLLFSVGATDGVFELLEAAAKQDPEDRYVKALLARAHWERATADGQGAAGDKASQHLAHAKRLLEQVSAGQAGGPAGVEAAILEGRLLLAQANADVTTDPSMAEKTIADARKAFRRAIRADDRMAEAYYGLGLTYLVHDNGSKEPIGVLEAASAMLPLSADVPLALARLHARRDDRAAARLAVRYAMQLGAHSGRYETARDMYQQLK